MNSDNTSLEASTFTLPAQRVLLSWSVTEVHESSSSAATSSTALT